VIDDPHHDGSPLHVPDQAPSLGSPVTLRMRGVADEVWIRTTQDAEPTFHPCVRDGEWWTGEIPMHNPVMHYRFLLVRDGVQTWLTGAGVFDHDVPDTFDFKVSSYPPAPDWSRDGVVYQIFPDRFARSAAADQRPTPAWAVSAAWDDAVVFEGSDPRTPLQFFGGDIDGIVEHLDHVAAVGATILYTTPVFPAESNHRYNASTFDEVDPLLGSDAAYQRLSEAVHARGWRLLGDLTSNHTGDTHEWFKRASTDPSTVERGFYFFHDDGSYDCWMGHGTLPKLDHRSPELRRRFWEGPESIVARWLRPPYDVDGWRIDVANMTGRLRAEDLNHQVQQGILATAAALRADALVIGEHNHDASGDVDVDGWHGTMNYSGFSWPVWEWLRDPASPARPFGTPVPVARRTGPQVVASMRMWMGRLGWRAFSSSWNILGSHDSARIRTLVGSAEAHHVAAGLQFTLPGVPMIFAGDELGLEGVNGEDSRKPMPWGREAGPTLGVYAGLAKLRADHVALRRGGLRWVHVDEDQIVFLREHSEGSVIVSARRAPGPSYAVDGELLFRTGTDQTPSFTVHRV
jgi:alpha-glucosidase